MIPQYSKYISIAIYTPNHFLTFVTEDSDTHLAKKNKIIWSAEGREKYANKSLFPKKMDGSVDSVKCYSEKVLH